MPNTGAGIASAELVERRLSALEKDIEHHASTIGEFTRKFAELDKENAVRNVEDENLVEYVKRIEKRIDQIYGFAKWLFLTFLSILVTLAANFVLGGGLNLPHQ